MPNDAFAVLKAQFPKAKDTIVFCVHVLQQNGDAGLDELKAQAGLHGLRVTAASVAAARRLLAGDGGEAQVPAKPRARANVANVGGDAEALLRQVLVKVQGQGQAEAERLRAAMRKAVALLEAAASL